MNLKHIMDDGPLVSRSLATSLISVLVVQTLAAVWWAASVGSDVNSIKMAAQSLRAESYTRVEASLMVQRLDQVDATINAKLTDVSGRVEQIAAQQRRTESIIMDNNARGKYSRSAP